VLWFIVWFEGRGQLYYTGTMGRRPILGLSVTKERSYRPLIDKNEAI
jgi:hypothetical protein